MAVVLITSAAQEQFDALPRVVAARMERICVRLEHWPDVSGAKPLSVNLAGHTACGPATIVCSSMSKRGTPTRILRSPRAW